jgi:hypothetical protein
MTIKIERERETPIMQMGRSGPVVPLSIIRDIYIHEKC